MARVTFQKYEGLGNDFILVEAPSGPAQVLLGAASGPAQVLLGAASGPPPQQRVDPAVVKRLCDRHFGIGADGVLLVSPGSSAGAEATMTVVNADGSQPEMCGNGLRCVALHLAAKQGKESLDLVIDTDAGPLACKVRRSEVEVDMGCLVAEGPVEVSVEGRVHRFTRISAGNPHAITFLPYEPRDIDEVGPRVSIAPVFPAGTNVEFARLDADGSIELVVWERGVGRTLACGTGACATVGAACLEGKRSFGEPITVRLPGGPLQVSVAQGSLRATMRGPARLVFRGEVSIS